MISSNLASQDDSKSDHPLIVDLDGTLIRTDMLHESSLRVLRDKPFHIFLIPYWLSQGKAILKKQLARHANIDAGALPYNHNLIDWLKQQKSQGRKLVLCTATDLSIANRIADYLGTFDEVLASDGESNLAGQRKADLLVQRFGHAGFDYVGNSHADLDVWKSARRGILVEASKNVLQKAREICEVEKEFRTRELGFATWWKVLRIHQWLKNLLLFVPFLAAHNVSLVSAWPSLILAFFSFGLCASSVYILNDLLDLESDRLHPRKRERPFASGMVPVWAGVALAPALFFISLPLAYYVGGSFLPWLLLYFVLTCTYSWSLKRLVLIDCLTLAMLYTLRIVAGAAAVEMELSFWLLAFAVFLFLSLAFVKRYAELEMQMLQGNAGAHGRGYHTSDASLIQSIGITSGYASVVVLTLYINSDAVLKLYQYPKCIWGTVPVILFWISWIWMKAHRGEMHDDPLIFAVRDKASLLAALAFVSVVVVGRIGLTW